MSVAVGVAGVARFRAQRERAHRVGDVLHLLLALVDEAGADLALDHGAGTASETVMPPGSASPSSRAAMFTPSP